MTVVSKQLAATNFGDASVHDLYTVPAGKRTIVKNMLARGASGSASHATWSVFDGATSLFSFNVYLAASGSDGDTSIINPWIVLNAGQTLKVQFSATGGWVSVSGAELVL